ncbi:hypothetical protein P43SY_010965 [Pythium insidiosum]|uniref:ATP-dependent RNA helicase n=1 Tax=Pythium insidiosum TaxID=114742 RepID=A0AAD5Q6J0_PYTIN|nr:hypothetical protein P43SY_010965 [Pythium insidiosum]
MEEEKEEEHAAAAITGHVATFIGVVNATHSEALHQWNEESCRRASRWARAVERIAASQDRRALDELLGRCFASASLPSLPADAVIDAAVLESGDAADVPSDLRELIVEASRGENINNLRRLGPWPAAMLMGVSPPAVSNAYVSLLLQNAPLRLDPKELRSRLGTLVLASEQLERAMVMLPGSMVRRPATLLVGGSRSHVLLHARRFQSLGVSAELTRHLNSLGFESPTPAQRQALPHILQRRDVVIAAETGGGKTLAYLVPLVEQLRRHPVALADVRHPVALILTTSQELVAQVARVLQTLSPDVARYSTALSSNQPQLPGRGTSVLIATPKALLRATKPKDFAFTAHLVVDEADMLLSGGAERDTKQILATIRNQPLVEASLNHRDSDVLLLQQGDAKAGTLPVDRLRRQTDYLRYKFPDAAFAVTKDFQRTLPRLDIHTHDLDTFMAEMPSSKDNTPAEELAQRRMELLDRLLMDDESGGHTLVFANSIDSAELLHDYLTTVKARDCLLYHKEISRDQRERILSQLQQPPATARGLVVVCTDIAARGLDTTHVRHVVQYEFASDVVSYLHRVGRTARAGSTGKVSSIVTRANDLVVSKIREAGADSLRGAFSRKRSLRKKVKKLSKSTP